jgi:hypothetical protein
VTQADGEHWWDEDDHDLLTFNESGARLRKEIELVRAELAEYPTPALQARLEGLTEAHERNTRTAADNPGEKGFLDYRPRGAEARR